jgi:hypothetical protein
MSWVSYFDNTKWQQAVGLPFGTWDGSEWDAENAGGTDYYLGLDSIGTWSDGFTPTMFRVTFTGATPLFYIFVDDNGNPIDEDDGSGSITSLQEKTLTFSSYNISAAFFGNYSGTFSITNIEFDDGSSESSSSSSSSANSNISDSNSSSSSSESFSFSSTSNSSSSSSTSDDGSLYGLRCYDSSGDLILDTTKRVTRLIDSREVAGGVDSYYDISDDFSELDDDDVFCIGFCLETNKTTASIKWDVYDTYIRVTYRPKGVSVLGETFPSGNTLIVTYGY